MRVIEPKQQVRKLPKNSKKKRTSRPVRTVSLLAILILTSVGLLGVATHYRDVAFQADQTSTLSASTVQDLEKVAAARDIKFKFFTPDQFQALYESVVYPNTQTLTTPPKITGNAAADARIRTIAESRGYTLRSVPVFPIVKTDEPRVDEDDLLQPKAYSGWLVLEDMAKRDNIPLIMLSSGYRSVEMQRELFLERLYARTSATRIASGQADADVVTVLSQAAPPGYSRHHTGYTIDLICNDGTGQSFKNTVCFKWIKANNYDKAKRAGWVPSYPEGVAEQGPEPEPWEYVWVGVNNLVE